MYHFNILYFDGKLSVTHQAILHLKPDHWIIQFTDQDSIEQIVRWEIDGIERDLGFNSLYIFRYGDFPKQTIECKDENLLVALKELYPGKPFFSKQINFLLSQNTTIITGLACALVGFIALAYFYILPWFAETVAENIPVSIETQMGETMYDNIITQYHKNDSLTRSVNDFVKEINFKTDYPVEVTVVKEDQMNAFALPGGHIVVFDKLLSKMKTKEELAALLAHEVAHVHYRHSLKSIFRSLSGYLLISLIFNDVNGIAAVLADNSNMLLNLSYSRKLEQDADEKAVEILQVNNLSLKGFADLFTLLKSESNDSKTLNLLSTHPLTDNRIKYAKDAAFHQRVVRNNDKLEEKWREIADQFK
ncbi:M48 family metallopeptidase [Dyadobacter subterraneus]|uniref:M48 family metallopeptidase n=1 Tax=Dyadobacter subterraneus TaxID=2773304 RepID=A0ABR9W5L4_9BACT|nr:M48 family metallopeptidase [Dyadobacter subterraneus]MBE9460261.1 M48 family metallopeptidase [Dyadobacter subterraneus]